MSVITAVNILQRYNQILGIPPDPPYQYSPQYQNVLDWAAANGANPPSLDINKRGEDQYYRKLVYSDAWNLLDKILILISHGDANFSLINIKSPGTKNATLPVSPSFLPGVGWTPNGTNQYINSRFSPINDGVNYSQDNVGILFYTPTSEAGSATKVEFGASNAAGANAHLASLRVNTNVCAFRLNQTSNTSIANTESAGFYHFKRTASNAVALFRNGISLGTASPASIGETLNEVFLGCFNSNGTPSGFSTKVIGFYAVGASLNGLEQNMWAYFRELISTKEEIAEITFGTWKNFGADLVNFLTGTAQFDASFSDVPTLNQEFLVGPALSGAANKYQGSALAENDYIYCAPSTNQKILRINSIDDTYSEIDTVLTNQAAKYGGCVYAVNKKVYFCPQNATAVMVYDTVTGEVYFFDSTGRVADNASGNMAGAVKWYGIYQGADGRLYCIPYNTDTVMIIDPSNDTLSFIDTTGVVSFGGGNLNDLAKWDGGCTYGNFIYGTPSDATDFLKINTLLGTCARFGSVTAGTSKWAIATVGADNFMYFYPYFRNDVIKMNPADDSFTTLAATIGSVDTNIKVAAAQLMADGRILLTPSTPTNSIMHNTGDGSLTTVGISLGAGNKYIGGCVARNGAQYTVPYNVTQILKQTYLGKYISLSQNFCLNRTGRYS